MRHVDPETILLCVRWYLSCRLSYRVLVYIMDERGLKIAHTTILRWVFRFSNELKHKVRPHLRKTLTSWKLDKTYIKVKGKWTYLYRAIDREGKIIDFYLSRKRDSKAAHSFFKKIIRLNSSQTPHVINVVKTLHTPM
ncbi:IS6 family transposase [bacterium]|nr:IS6 family transposase [bacterium]